MSSLYLLIGTLTCYYANSYYADAIKQDRIISLNLPNWSPPLPIHRFLGCLIIICMTVSIYIESNKLNFYYELILAVSYLIQMYLEDKWRYNYLIARNLKAAEHQIMLLLINVVLTIILVSDETRKFLVFIFLWYIFVACLIAYSNPRNGFH